MVERAFPNREIIQIEASDLVHGGGGVRSVTRPQPAPPPTAAAEADGSG